MKKKIDKYFTDNYDTLLEVAERNVKYYNRSYYPCDVISYAYEYCLRSQDYEMDNIDNVVHRVIITSCYWEDSPLNRKMLLKQTPFAGMEDVEPIPKEYDYDEILEKVMLEKWYNDKKSVLELYRRKIATDKPKLIVLDKMIKLKTRNSRQLAEVFAIPHTTMYLMVREIQDELREFEEDINNYDNKSNFNR